MSASAPVPAELGLARSFGSWQLGIGGIAPGALLLRAETRIAGVQVGAELRAGPGCQGGAVRLMLPLPRRLGE